MQLSRILATLGTLTLIVIATALVAWVGTEPAKSTGTNSITSRESDGIVSQSAPLTLDAPGYPFLNDNPPPTATSTPAPPTNTPLPTPTGPTATSTPAPPTNTPLPTPTKPTATAPPSPTLPVNPMFGVLLAKIAALDGPPGIRISLTSKVTAAQKLAELVNPCAAANVMEAFISQLEAASGTRIPVPIADALINQAETIISQLDGGACPPDADADGDFAPDSAEITLGTDPGKPDTDGDTLVDGLELFEVGTDPLDPTTNGTPDAEEDPDTDGCTTGTELGPDPQLGGQRNPVDFWDFYDVLGPGAALPTDGIIDLPNDILGVIQHFSPQGQPPYDVRFDRGPQIGANVWNMGPPDGVIDLPNDILGVIQQFGHNCQ